MIIGSLGRAFQWVALLVAYGPLDILGIMASSQPIPMVVSLGGSSWASWELVFCLVWLAGRWQVLSKREIRLIGKREKNAQRKPEFSHEKAVVALALESFPVRPALVEYGSKLICGAFITDLKDKQSDIQKQS